MKNINNKNTSVTSYPFLICINTLNTYVRTCITFSDSFESVNGDSSFIAPTVTFLSVANVF